ncbi:MAG: autotransporter domain-containing protein [Candidatus Accumulibacter sp.]|jgi:autotransporter-associated beta strand protein|nr:autotransporter domain-containing protein [Accumulibacter sp.]
MKRTKTGISLHPVALALSMAFSGAVLAAWSPGDHTVSGSETVNSGVTETPVNLVIESAAADTSLTVEGEVNASGAISVAGSTSADKSGTLTIRNDGVVRGRTLTVSGGMVGTGANGMVTVGNGTLTVGQGIEMTAGSKGEARLEIGTGSGGGATLKVDAGGLDLKGMSLGVGKGGISASVTIHGDASADIAGDIVLGDFGQLKVNTHDFVHAGNIIARNDAIMAGLTFTLTPDADKALTVGSNISGRIQLGTVKGGGGTDEAILILTGRTSGLTSHIDVGADTVLKLKNDGDLSGASITVRGTLDLSGITSDTARIKLWNASGQGDVITGNVRNLEVELMGGTSLGDGKVLGGNAMNGSSAGEDSPTNIRLFGRGDAATDVKLKGKQSHTGTTTVDARNGKGDVNLVLGNGGSIENSSELILLGKSGSAQAKFSATDAPNPVLKGLSGNQYSEVGFSGQTLTIDTELNSRFGGTLNGGNLVKKGSGALTLGGQVTSIADITLDDGGALSFDKQVGPSGDVTLNSGTLTFSDKLEVAGDIILHEGTLNIGETARAANFEARDAGARLGLAMSQNNSTLSATNVDITGVTTIDIPGFAERTASSASYTLINATGTLRANSRTDGSDIVFDGDVLIGGTPLASVDFIDIGKVEVGSKTVKVTSSGLAWNKKGSDVSKAHGTLTVESEFTVGTALGDNADAAGGKGLNGWDGATLEKRGAGTLTLAGNNTYTGPTLIAEGTLEIKGSLGNGSYAGAIANAGTLVFDQNRNQTLSGDIGGTGSLVKKGSGVLTLKGNNSYSGMTTVGSGATLEIRGSLDSVAANVHGGDIINEGTLKFTNPDVVQTFSGDLGGSGTTVIGADARLVVDGILSGAEGNIHQGNIENAGILTLDQSVNQEIGGSISGAGKLIKAGEGKLTLSGDNTSYSGVIKLDEGATLSVGEDKNLGKRGRTNVLNNATLELTGNSCYASGSNANADWKLVNGTTNALVVTRDGGEETIVFGGNIQFEYDGDDDPTYLIFSAPGKTIQLTGFLRNFSEGSPIVDRDTTVDLSKEGQDVYRYTGMTTVREGGTLRLGSSNVWLENNRLTLIESTFDRAGGHHSLKDGEFKVTNHAIYGGDLEAGGADVRFTLEEPLPGSRNGVVLDVMGGDADFSDADLNVRSRYKLDDVSLVRVEVGHEIVLDDARVSVEGGLHRYELSPGDDGLTLNAARSGEAVEEAKVFSEGFLGGAALLNMGGDVLMEKGVSSAVGSVGNSTGAAFGAIGGGSLKHKTGSHVDVSGVSLVAGLARSVAPGATVGGFIEYGDGDYDSHNSFSRAGKVKGSGDTDYFGVGVLGRFDLARTADGQSYLETSARLGRVNNDFKTGDFDIARGNVKFDTRSNYYGLSLGGGHVWTLDADSTVDLYGRYVWTHQEGDSARLTGLRDDSRVKFSDVDSQRVRVGARYSQAWDSSSQFYAGVAWEHEFDGKAGGKIDGDKIDAPGMKGSTGIVEVGLVLYPSANKNLSIDLGIQGYGGKRQGVTGGVQVKYAF